MKSVLFLCTGNSCRSQMAEGWARTLFPSQLNAYSAGLEAKGINPYAIQVMSEVGVDISGQRSELVSNYLTKELDLVVTVCDHADAHCPTLPNKAKSIHVGFDDPPELAKTAGSKEEALIPYRRVRDEIKEFIAKLSQELKLNPSEIAV